MPTTMTPDFAAFVDRDRVRARRALPNGEPSDMLITSMSLLTAHSIAWIVSFARARAAEDADGVEVGLRRDAGTDDPRCCR